MEQYKLQNTLQIVHSDKRPEKNWRIKETQIWHSVTLTRTVSVEFISIKRQWPYKCRQKSDMLIC